MDLPNWDADDENKDEFEVEESAFFGREGWIFLIDASKQMFQENENKEIYFKICLECCKTTMLNKIINSENDLIGIVLYGTDKMSNELNLSHLYTLQDVEPPSADKIKRLEKMLQSDLLKDFSNEYGHSDNASLSDALWLCQTLFSKNPSKSKLSSQKILLFTNTDNPYEDSPSKQQKARTKAKDIGENNIELELLHLGSSFNPDLFYKDLVQLTKRDDSDDWVLPNPSNKIEELLARMCRKDYKKRTTGRVYFTLGEGVKLSVSIYCLVRRAAQPRQIKLDKRTNYEVKSTSKKYDANTGSLILPTEVNKYQEFAFKKIILTPEEVRSLRNITEPGLKLLGFKPASSIKMHHHIRPSLFIYPDESLVQGSRKIFAALLERCIEKNVVPICYLSRTVSKPSLVALKPQKEVLDSNVQLVPPGFHVLYLPYSEDIRKLDIESSMKAEPEHIEQAKKLVRKLRFPYSPHKFDNPKLQTHWKSIEALALDHPDSEPITDLTVPNHDAMRDKLGPLAQEFIEEVYPAGYTPGGKPKSTAGRKRTAQAANEIAPKIEKSEDVDNAMRELVEQGKVEKRTNKDLIEYLTLQGYKVRGFKKADLVSKIYEHFGIPQPQ